MHARIARYGYTGDAHSIARKAEEGALPIFQSMPGFRSYSILESDDEIFSLSVWDSAEHAEAANPAVAKWVAENLADEVELKEARIGEILVSTILGVSATTGVTA